MSDMSNPPRISGLDPAFRIKRETVRRIAPRLATLEGATLALVINRLGYSERFGAILGERLMAALPLADIVHIVKRDISVPPDPEHWAIIQQRATAAVTLFGGCGSCSTRTFRDAVDCEAAGIPAVALIAEALSQGVATLARLTKMQDYRFITLERQHNNQCLWSDEECRIVADTLVPRIAAYLTVADTAPAMAG